MRIMPRLRSAVSRIFSLAMGAQKLGQPVPESNLAAGVEERGIATDAAEDAWGVIVGIFVGVGALGCGVARDFERVGRELLAPLVVCFHDFGDGDGVLALASIGEDDNVDQLRRAGGHCCCGRLYWLTSPEI